MRLAVRSRPRALKFVTALAILAPFPLSRRSRIILRKQPKNLPIIRRNSPKGNIKRTDWAAGVSPELVIDRSVQVDSFGAVAKIR